MMNNICKNLYPLKFTPIYKEKVWGGRTLKNFNRQLPGDDHTYIGESWELVNLKQTSVSGGGGDAEHSIISNGFLKGKTIAEVIEIYGRAITGSLPLTREGGFPFLVKYLDANNNLSVQVHPNREYVHQYSDTYQKDECWYILHAKDDAVIYKGVKAGTTETEFRRAIKTNTLDELLIKIPVKSGDCHYIPSGTCHALGKGILAAEVQTTSDTTFRVYDWGRTDRELHIESAMACIQLEPAVVSHNEQRITKETDAMVCTQLVNCEHFKLEHFAVKTEHQTNIENDEPVIWMVLEGDSYLSSDAEADVPVRMGETLLFPPNIKNGKAHLTQGTKWLKITSAKVNV